MRIRANHQLSRSSFWQRSVSPNAGEAGFTLVEMMLVILIIGILLAIALPTFLNQQDKAQDTSTKSMLTNVAHVANADYIQSSIQRKNLIKNPSFETSCGNGWTGQSATLTVDGTQASAGSHSCKVTTSGTATYGEGIQMAAGGPKVVPGKEYAFSIDVKGPAGEQLELYLDWRNAGGTALGPASTALFTTDGSWQRIDLTKVATATSGSTDLVPASADLKVTGRNGQSQGAMTFWVDGAMLEQSYTAGAYFDGSSNGGSWSGAANASASSITTTTDDTFPPQIADMIATSEPEYTVTSTGLYPADPNTVDVQYVNSNVVVLRATSSDGTHYVYELDYAGNQRRNLRLTGTNTTATTNLILNPSFETDAGKWTNGGSGTSFSTVSTSASWAADGTRSAHLVTNVPAGGYANLTCCTAPLPGGKMSAQITVNIHSITGGSGLHIGFNWLNGSGNYLTGGYGAALPAGTTGVHTLELEGLTPNAAASQWSFTVQVTNQNGQPAGSADFDLDAVQVTASSSVLPYFDGSYPDAIWNGPVGGSTSAGYAWGQW